MLTHVQQQLCIHARLFAGVTQQQMLEALSVLHKQVARVDGLQVQPTVRALGVLTAALRVKARAQARFQRLALCELINLLNFIPRTAEAMPASSRVQLQEAFNAASAAAADIHSDRASSFLVKGMAQLVRGRMPAVPPARRSQLYCQADRLLSKSADIGENCSCLIGMYSYVNDSWVEERVSEAEMRNALRPAITSLLESLRPDKANTRICAAAAEVPGLIGEAVWAFNQFCSTLPGLQCDACKRSPAAGAHMLRACKRCEAAYYCSQCALHLHNADHIFDKTVMRKCLEFTRGDGLDGVADVRSHTSA